MNYKAHLMFGLLFGLLFLTFYSVSNSILFVCLCLFGSLLPDIDHPKSKIGSLVKPFSFLFTHRGFFHSIFPLVVFYFLIGFNDVLFIPVAVGYVSHLLADMFTHQGIMVIHPIINVKISGFIKTGGFFESIIVGVLFVVNILLIFNL